MIVTGDFETYYDRDYSLKKLTTAEYILDPRFETIMLSLKIDNGPSNVFLGKHQVEDALSHLNWDNVAWLSHHTNFDASILHWHYGRRPALYLCSMSMARATIHWKTGRSSLDAVSKYFNLPPKGDEVVKAMGKHLCHFTRDELIAYANYCVRDNENCRAAFDRMRPKFTNAELRLIDLIIRMHVEPQVQLNPTLLAEHLAEVQAEKQLMFERVKAIDPAVFSSQMQFAALLELEGVEVPRKPSPTNPDQMVYALAKGDRGFRELCQDPTLPPFVQALLAARTSAKSTIDETRSKRLLSLSLKHWPGTQTGYTPIAHQYYAERSGRVAHPAWAPVPLKYFGARTGRLSGDDLMNWQNFRRGSKLKEAVEAPPSYRIVHRDSSQIEARMVAWLAACYQLLDAFRDPQRDVYCEFATSVYGQKVTPADKLRRFVGKTGILGLGYGCGAAKFRHMLFIGNGGISVSVDEKTAESIVEKYRGLYSEIRKLWRRGGTILNELIKKAGRRSYDEKSGTDEEEKQIKQVREALRGLPIELGFESVWLPNDMCLSYPGIHWDIGRNGLGEIYYQSQYGQGLVRLYGAKFIENLSQALTRIIITDIAGRVFEATGYHPFLTTHDSLDYCVPEAEAEGWDAYLEREFSLVPTWAPTLPLASEGGWGKNLLLAEKGVNE